MHSRGGWEGKEIRKAAYHEVKRVVTFYSSWRSPPHCLYSFHVVLSEFFARVYYHVLPDRKQTAILWPTSCVLQPSLSCAIWGIYSVTHHWESRGLPLYSKHYATIMRNWDKWQPFLPTKCHNTATLNHASRPGHCVLFARRLSLQAVTEARGCTWGSTWKVSLNALQAKWSRAGVRGEAGAPQLGQHLSTQHFPRTGC